ncbi:MAG: hypothetical protein HQK52_03175 [Oligoflexia bacterium]|nr:hypothetical protein [Oligoflexia bacterium]
MFQDTFIVLLAKLNLRLDRITFNNTSAEVVVGVIDQGGSRFVGRVGKNGDPFKALQEAFEQALTEFDPTWRNV